MFSWCINLISVELPESLKYLESSIFYRCNELKSIFYHGTVDNFYEIKNWQSLYGVLDIVCYYSETEPDYDSVEIKHGILFWHYGEDGKTPLVWVKEET